MERIKWFRKKKNQDSVFREIQSIKGQQKVAPKEERSFEMNRKT